MATTDFNAKTELIFLEEMYKLDVLHPVDRNGYLLFLQHNFVESMCASTVFEHSIAYINTSIIKESVYGRDFSDGSDGKTSTAQTYEKVRECIVNCTGKEGAIRIMAYESILKRFYYFYVPKELYSKIIKIPFDLEGNPKRINQQGYNKIWLCECPTFIDMALSMPGAGRYYKSLISELIFN